MQPSARVRDAVLVLELCLLCFLSIAMLSGLPSLLACLLALLCSFSLPLLSVAVCIAVFASSTLLRVETLA